MRRIYSRSLSKIADAPTNTPRTLTMDNYLGPLYWDRHAWTEFNEWLFAEELPPELIFEMTFDEGHVLVKCFDKHTQEPRERRLPVRTPPPPSVLAYLI